MKTYEEDRANWLSTFKLQGHQPIIDKDDGEPDIFVYDGGTHNGPGCARCGWSCCWHCTSAQEIPVCKAPNPFTEPE